MLQTCVITFLTTQQFFFWILFMWKYYDNIKRMFYFPINPSGLAPTPSNLYPAYLSHRKYTTFGSPASESFEFCHDSAWWEITSRGEHWNHWCLWLFKEPDEILPSTHLILGAVSCVTIVRASGVTKKTPLSLGVLEFCLSVKTTWYFLHLPTKLFFSVYVCMHVSVIHAYIIYYKPSSNNLGQLKYVST